MDAEPLRSALVAWFRVAMDTDDEADAAVFGVLAFLDLQRQAPAYCAEYAAALLAEADAIEAPDSHPEGRYYALEAFRSILPTLRAHGL